MNPLRWPLTLRVFLGVVLGAAVGFYARQAELGFSTAKMGILAGFYIQLLTTLATPLIFLAIVEAFVQTSISGRQGLKMFVICIGNVTFAFLIGLTILNIWKPGKSWEQSLARPEAVIGAAATDSKFTKWSEHNTQVSLNPLDLLRSYIPKSIAQPFAENMVLTSAVLAMLVGAAMRSLKAKSTGDILESMVVFERFIVASYQIILKILYWLIELAPLAIGLAVASVVSEAGLSTFRLVGVFFLTTTTALGVHALVYYPLTAWLIGGKSPIQFLREGASAIVTGFSLNSSLATAPLTLAALKRMRISDASARLSACVGTNFNNDGITLYEAMTALFIAQAAGLELDIGQQIAILLAALAGSMGIAGIPNSGLIILTLVLKAARLPEETVQLALPIVFSIDFVIARLRSAVNVMGDMQVAILLDASKRSGGAETVSL